MAARNKIAANQVIFAMLDAHCSSREEPLANAGAPRWISTTKAGRVFLVRASLTEHLSISTSVKLARFDLFGNAYFVTCGMEVSRLLFNLQAEQLDGGILTAFLSELVPRPTASPSTIRNIIEFADRSSVPDYDGHDYDSITSLFGNIQVHRAPDLPEEETFKVFFLLCLADRRRVDHWIDQQLADALAELGTLSCASFPFQVLCRPLLDMDPAALFLSLYRCLESLYAHADAKSLMDAIGLQKDWIELAETLEQTLGWYPREEPSLEALLAAADPRNLRTVAEALNTPIPKEAKESTFVARQIYRLRNALVHYRPFHKKYSTKAVDWNRLCEAMTFLARDCHRERSA